MYLEEVTPQEKNKIKEKTAGGKIHYRGKR